MTPRTSARPGTRYAESSPGPLPAPSRKRPFRAPIPSLSAGSATTDASGHASVTAQLANHSGDVVISACVPPNNVPCANFTLFAMPSSLWKMQPISGSAQVVQHEQPFEPLLLRVHDGSAAGNP